MIYFLLNKNVINFWFDRFFRSILFVFVYLFGSGLYNDWRVIPKNSQKCCNHILRHMIGNSFKNSSCNFWIFFHVSFILLIISKYNDHWRKRCWIFSITEFQTSFYKSDFWFFPYKIMKSFCVRSCGQKHNNHPPPSQKITSELGFWFRVNMVDCKKRFHCPDFVSIRQSLLWNIFRICDFLNWHMDQAWIWTLDPIHQTSFVASPDYLLHL